MVRVLFFRLGRAFRGGNPNGAHRGTHPPTSTDVLVRSSDLRFSVNHGGGSARAAMGNDPMGTRVGSSRSRTVSPAVGTSRNDASRTSHPACR
jgi:hypothetical protein